MNKQPIIPQYVHEQSLPTCYKCNRILTLGEGNIFKSTNPSSEPITKCRSCALMHIPMLKKSAITAIVVGSILTVLNQGDLILSGGITITLLWKVPLTFMVPFCVATFSGLANTRR